MIIGLDTAGVLFGWKFFDHAAHLGGAFCGMYVYSLSNLINLLIFFCPCRAWAYWGNEHLWQKRDFILQHWHDIRGQIKK